MILAAAICTHGARASEEQQAAKRTALRQYHLFPQISGGMIGIHKDPQLQSGLHGGYIVGAGAGISMISPGFGFDLKLGWSSSSVNVTASQALQSSAEKLPGIIETSFGEIEASARLRFTDMTEAGFSFLFPFGSDTDFGATINSEESQSVFLGPELLLSGTGKRDERIRIGLQCLYDLNITQRDVFFLRASVRYSIPFSVTPDVIYRERIQTKIKKVIRYKPRDRVKVVTQYHPVYLIDAGVIYFTTGKHQVSSPEASYLTDLARLLRQHDKDWAMIQISSNTDKRGSDALNQKLSADRAQEIVKILTQNGMSLARMKIRSRENENPVEQNHAPLSLARNRRVELTISGSENMEKLKSDILLLLQRYQLPSTCNGASCR